jgi:exopolysaccharide production protein ExoZ
MQQQLNSLQLYRGISSILVVLHHANIVLGKAFQQDVSFNLFHFGWIGVDFFFVLSGFIIFYIHQSDIGQPQQFKSFIKKRFFRIYPLYWIILLSKVFISLLGDRNGEIQHSNFFQFLQAFLLVPQDRANLEIFIGVSWTLTYEIFFYWIFSLSIIIRPKIYWPIFTIWLIGILLNLVGVLPVAGSLVLDFVFNARNLEFIFGCLAAYWISNHQIKYPKPLIYSALAMIIISILNTKYREFDVTGISPVIAYGIPFMLLIIGSVQIEKARVWQVPAFLIFLGNASYSIYLTHGFFIDKLTKVYIDISKEFSHNLLLSPVDHSHFIFTLLIILVSILMGGVIYFYIEKPLLKIFKSKQFRPKMLPAHSTEDLR